MASADPELLQPEWYSVATARGEELKNKPMVGNCFLCHAYWVILYSMSHRQMNCLSAPESRFLA
jgi:hypothetical protein